MALCSSATFRATRKAAIAPAYARVVVDVVVVVIVVVVVVVIVVVVAANVENTAMVRAMACSGNVYSRSMEMTAVMI